MNNQRKMKGHFMILIRVLGALLLIGLITLGIMYSIKGADSLMSPLGIAIFVIMGIIIVGGNIYQLISLIKRYK